MSSIYWILFYIFCGQMNVRSRQNVKYQRSIMDFYPNVSIDGQNKRSTYFNKIKWILWFNSDSIRYLSSFALYLFLAHASECTKVKEINSGKKLNSLTHITHIATYSTNKIIILLQPVLWFSTSYASTNEYWCHRIIHHSTKYSSNKHATAFNFGSTERKKNRRRMKQR